MTTPKNPIRSAAITLCAALPLTLTACAGLGLGFSGGSGSSKTEALNNLTFETEYPIRAMRSADPGSADIYLTDLSDDELSAFFAEPRDWSGITGTIVHVHLFLEPKPGNTPIDPTAASASVRSIIIASGEVGIYDGAGFLLPGGSIKSGRLSGTVRRAPIRLTHATPGFRDPLEAPAMTVSFSVREDTQSAEELDARVDALAAYATRLDN